MADKINSVKVGSKFSRHSFGEVVALGTANGIPGARVKNEAGLEWFIGADVIEKEFDFADFETEEKKLSATALQQLLLDNRYTAMTVNFNKKIDEKEIQKKLLSCYPNKGGKLLSETEFKQKVKDTVADLTKGEERTMIGYHKGSIDTNGRLAFYDMDVKTGFNMRLVDPRTLNYLIVKGVKYVVK